MNQFSTAGFNKTLTALMYFEIISALIAIGVGVFVLWMMYTWVTSYRRWASSDIAIRRGTARESAARTAKLNAETTLLRHEIQQKGLNEAGDSAGGALSLNAKDG